MCFDCKQARKAKAKEWLKKAGKVVGVATVVASAAYLASQSSVDDGGKEYNYIPDADNGGVNHSMKCANCGNTDENSLWDEGDTIYCSLCAHRTSIDTGECDEVECPYCHRMRDRKAMYCRWCNDSTWVPSSQDEFEEIDKILKDMGS